MEFIRSILDIFFTRETTDWSYICDGMGLQDALDCYLGWIMQYLPNLDDISKMGAVYIVAILVGLIYHIHINPPKK